jgi:c-di-GMP-binding flagellar brake protein YcgR
VSDISSISITEFVEVGDRLTVSIRTLGDMSRHIGFESYIKHAFENRLLLHVPENLHLESFLLPETPINIEFQKNTQAMPRISTTVVSYNNEHRGCWVIVPPDFKEFFLKRRRHVRIPAKFPLKIVFFQDGQEAVIPGTCLNMSGGGMRFIIEQSFEVGDRFRLEFQPELNAAPFRLQAEVVLCKPSPYRSTTKNLAEMMIAVKFANLLPTQEDQLVGICFRKELEHQRHLKE